MSYKVLKHIEMTLDRQSVGNAIREINRFREELQKTMLELVEKLMNEGVEIAKMQTVSLDAFDTGELEGSIHGYFIPDWRVGFVRVGAPYAIFVEYGTGVTGKSSPHPGISDNDWNNPVVAPYGKAYNGYDSQGHGSAGWVYKSSKDGQYYWTKGYYSRPFLYNTFRWLEEAAPERAAELFAQM